MTEIVTPTSSTTHSALESILGSIEALPNETPDLDDEIAAAVEQEVGRTVSREEWL